jgi:hypothetical protein
VAASTSAPPFAYDSTMILKGAENDGNTRI